MEAVVFDGKTLSLKYEKNFPMPKVVNDDDVIVKVAYSGVCGTDLHIIQGEFPSTKERPIVMGHEFSGMIYDVGKSVTFKIGQHVVVDPNRPCNLCKFCRKGLYQHCLSADVNAVGVWRDGGWAQYCKVPQVQVFKLPPSLTLDQAGLCEPLSCVVHGFQCASPLVVGEKMLVIGTGIIGKLWMAALHHQGHRDVTVAGTSESRLESVKNLGTGFKTVTSNALERENRVFDVIIDCTGVSKVMEMSFNHLSHGGKYVVFGCCPPSQRALVNPFQIYAKELTVIGVKINPYSFPTAIGWLSAMGDKYLDYKKLGVRTYKLCQYQEALKDLKERSISKAVFKIE